MILHNQIEHNGFRYHIDHSSSDNAEVRTDEDFCHD
jgi:hypothetical protein